MAERRGRRIEGRKLMSLALLAAGLALIGYYVYVHFAGQWVRRAQVDESPAIEPPAMSAPAYAPAPTLGASGGAALLLYPTDRLFTTSGRKIYADGDMVLRVPRLSLEAPVLDGTDDRTLRRGVGLYPYSPVPTLEENANANVSIAGHRDIYGAEFYAVDKVAAGDLLYLTYGGDTYVYAYESTVIVEPDDWGPIHCKDYACLTLTSCDPIGTSEKRIVVTSRLTEVLRGSENAP